MGCITQEQLDKSPVAEILPGRNLVVSIAGEENSIILTNLDYEIIVTIVPGFPVEYDPYKAYTIDKEELNLDRNRQRYEKYTKEKVDKLHEAAMELLQLSMRKRLENNAIEAQQLLDTAYKLESQSIEMSKM